MKALLTALQSAEKTYAKSFRYEEPRRISTGFLTVDSATGGGFLEGRIVEVYGPESAGKTTFALMSARSFIGPGEVGLLMDYEHAAVPSHVRAISGCEVIPIREAKDYFTEHGTSHPPLILHVMPMTLEEGVDLVMFLWETLQRRLRYVLDDSLSAMTPKDILEGSAEDNFPALQARHLSIYYAKVSKCFEQTATTLFVICQVRMKLDFHGGRTEETSASIRALRHYEAQRLKFSSGEGTGRWWKALLGPSSHMTFIRIEKNKTSPDRRGMTHLVFWPGRGLSPEVELIELAEEAGIMPQGDSAGERIFRGISLKRGRWLSVLIEPERGPRMRDLMLADLAEKIPSGRYIFEEHDKGVGSVNLLADEE